MFVLFSIKIQKKMIDQETVAFTLIAAGIGYMILTNLQGNPVDEEAERQKVLEGMRSRASEIKKYVLDIHSRAGDLDDVETQRQGVVQRFLAMQQQNEMVGAKYPEFQRVARSITVDVERDIKRYLPQSVYHGDQEMLEPLEGRAHSAPGAQTPKKPGERRTQSMFNPGSEPDFVQLQPGEQHGLQLRDIGPDELKKFTRERDLSYFQRPRTRMASDLPSISESGAEMLPALKRFNRHNLESGSRGAAPGRSAFVTLAKSASPASVHAEERSISRAAISDATSLLVNKDHSHALVNNDTPVPKPVPQVSDHVNESHFKDQTFGPKNPRLPVGENVVKSFEPDENKSAHDNNRLDNQQPAVSSSFMQSPIPVADNKTDSPPNDKRAAEELSEGSDEGGSGSAKAIDLTRSVGSSETSVAGFAFKVTSVFEEFVSEERHQEIIDSTRDEIMQDIDTIQRLLEGRKRENTQGDYTEAKKDLLRLLPNNNKLKEHIKVWDQQLRNMNFPDIRLKSRPITNVAGGGRASHAEIERGEHTDRVRRDREQVNVDRRGREREDLLNQRRKVVLPRVTYDPSRPLPGGVKPDTPIVMHSGREQRDTSANYPITIAAFEQKNPGKYAQMMDAHGALANQFRKLWTGHRVASIPKTFYEHIRDAMFPNDRKSPSLTWGQALLRAERIMKSKEFGTQAEEMKKGRAWGEKQYRKSGGSSAKSKQIWDNWVAARKHKGLPNPKGYKMHP